MWLDSISRHHFTVTDHLTSAGSQREYNRGQAICPTKIHNVGVGC
jgi:hypothetical protein